MAVRQPTPPPPPPPPPALPTALPRSWFVKRVTQVRAQADGQAAESLSSKPRRALALEVTTHVYLVTALLAAHVSMHGWLVTKQVNAMLAEHKELDW